MGEYMLRPGYDWNPLKRHRNLPCPCGSGKKLKRCHGEPSALPTEDVELAKTYLTKLAQYGFIKRREGETA